MSILSCLQWRSYGRTKNACRSTISDILVSKKGWKNGNRYVASALIGEISSQHHQSNHSSLASDGSTKSHQSQEARVKFVDRHIGPDQNQTNAMLKALQLPSIEELVSRTIPSSLIAECESKMMSRRRRHNRLVYNNSDDEECPSEHEALASLKRMMRGNRILRSYIGLGYSNCRVPAVIVRNILEDPGWYTSYTPYQPEIAQGRLESLLNFQTMVSDLTRLPVANASLLDEATAAAEAMFVCYESIRGTGNNDGGNVHRWRFFVDEKCLPQTIAVIRGRAEPFPIDVVVDDYRKIASKDHYFAAHDRQEYPMFGILLAYPNCDGEIHIYDELIKQAHDRGIMVVCSTDLLALTLIRPPGEFGIDIAIGNTQRLGVPLGYGGPHAAFFACRESYQRRLPGRLVGVSRDMNGHRALRLTLQTREQHIRREHATSNICTAQTLPANMSAMYAIYHGPEGLRTIASRIHQFTWLLKESIIQTNSRSPHIANVSNHDSDPHCNQVAFFDTITIEFQEPIADKIINRALRKGINLRQISNRKIAIALDETVSESDLRDLYEVIMDIPDEDDDGGGAVIGEDQQQKCTQSNRTGMIFDLNRIMTLANSRPPLEVPKYHKNEQETSSSTTTMIHPSSCALSLLRRTSKFLQHPVFLEHQSETELIRYMKHLQSKDASLIHAMIPLGSCTMKLNATTEMLPLTWPEVTNLHPFVPLNQARGYQRLFRALENRLCEITAFDAFSFQPNSGAQGEYAGLRTIRAYFTSRGESHRDVCLIPVSSHGTNPASASRCGLRIIPIACRPDGSLDATDVERLARIHSNRLAVIMLTYPSTHGIFDKDLTSIINTIHRYGGQVYLDGANFNAQIGYLRPGMLGFDACHVNLHKTFCIPHGGGGPGMGPLGVKRHLIPFLPGHPLLHSLSSNNSSYLNYEREPNLDITTTTSRTTTRDIKEDNRPPTITTAPVSAAPWSSSSILPISYMYMKLMGKKGLRKATDMALMNANYMRKRLENSYIILFTNQEGFCAHEFILDVRPFKKSANIEVADIAKRLHDYGFHSPTMSWPVTGTLMIEPTESESKPELDRFCDALISIRQEIHNIEQGCWPKDDNPLKNAPHPIHIVAAHHWNHPYSREQAAYPLPYLRHRKFWPSTSRIDEVYGDRHMMCTCPPIDFLTSSSSNNENGNENINENS